MLTRLLGALLITGALTSGATTAHALGTETFGNAPLNAANYGDWPGVMPVANHTSRVYHTWVNGNEHFYYEGSQVALNDALKHFAAVQTPMKTLVLRPAPGQVRSFDQTKTIKFNWSLHLIGGIAKHVTTLEKGDKVWSAHPVLTIYVDRTIDLKRLEIPKELSVKTISEVKRTVREGLSSGDKTVRGWGAGELARLDAYDDVSRDAIAGLLKDPDDWVRLNAAGAITVFGAKAKTALPLLRTALASQDKHLRERAQESIQTIETSPSRVAEEREHRRIDAEIERTFGAGKRASGAPR